MAAQQTKETTPYLQVTEAKGVRQVPLASGPLTVGRNFTNLLVLEEPMASRFHCVLEKTGEGWLVRDLGSRNGTKVNGAIINSSLISNGDVIMIGKTELKLMMPAPAIAEAPAPDIDALAELLPSDEQVAEALEGEEEPPALEAVGETPSQDWDASLRQRAESLPERGFGENDIVLMNARNQTVHQAGKTKESRADAITMLRLLLLICFRSRATDIHLEPKETDALLRIRVDGGMVDVLRMDKELGIRLASAVKVLSDIDIGQKNIIQEGHFSTRVPPLPGQTRATQRRVDYRISFAPAIHGQKMVVRILDTANAPLHIDDLMLPPRARDLIKQTSEQESGMILVCGPTGSGKTTTLYSILRDIDTTQRNVVTIEDPVEIQLDGVTQIPVNEEQGNTFSALLRSVLRQDPDAILIGEMRDAETARVGVQAGMTGHLVFSTVHARDAVGGIFRMLDLGVEPYLVSAGLHLIVAQRLVRLLCPACKKPVAPTKNQIERMAKEGITGVSRIYVAKGCSKCLGTGFRGRRGVYEVLNTTAELREVILKNPSPQDIQKALGPDNYLRLAESAYRLVADGLVSFDEADRSVA